MAGQIPHNPINEAWKTYFICCKFLPSRQTNSEASMSFLVRHEEPSCRGHSLLPNFCHRMSLLLAEGGGLGRGWFDRCYAATTEGLEMSRLPCICIFPLFVPPCLCGFYVI